MKAQAARDGFSDLFVDQFEPDNIVATLRTCAEVKVEALNNQGFADYMWVDVKGQLRQWERKQCSEVIGDLDGTEEQLNRELSTCDELTLVVEGVAMPAVDGINTYTLSGDGAFFRPLHHLGHEAKLWARWEAWKWGIRAAGVSIIETPTWLVTGTYIGTAYRQSLKSEHTTLRRYLVPHISPFSPNLYVENLARLKGCGIGPKSAEKLVARFGSFFDALIAPVEDIADCLGSTKGAIEFLHGLGRIE